MDTVEAAGNCLCGKVEITAKTVSPNVGACHCDMCRKWGSGPFFAVDCGENKNVSFVGEENITVFDSSEWAERGFCSKCGTHLFYRFKKHDKCIMPVDVFNDISNLKFDHQIFIEEKPEYYCFVNDTKNMTGEEVFKLFSGT